jgi:pyridinium-3,5-bisthiocarboxylic acid mononucleotide nickel chelatase
VLETNLDDISSEMIGYCIGQVWAAGALDVYTTAIQMKKSRPGVVLSVLCRPADAAPIESILFRETTTLGVRRWLASRHTLPRKNHRVETAFGPIEGKVAWLADGAVRFSPEFESCRRIAAERDLPLRVVYEAAHRAFDAASVVRG